MTSIWQSFEGMPLTLQSFRGQNCCLSGSTRQSIEQSWIPLGLYYLMEFTVLGFDLRVIHPFLLSYFPLLEWGCLHYAYLTVVFWMHIVFLV